MDLLCEYANLAYACTRCNTYKGENRIVDPTATPMGTHLRVGPDGEVEALTSEGAFLVRLLRLNEDPALSVRRHYLILAELVRDYPDDERVKLLCGDVFGYPVDMPDLRTLRPPQGNTLSGSELGCYFARQERGEVSDTY